MDNIILEIPELGQNLNLEFDEGSSIWKSDSDILLIIQSLGEFSFQIIDKDKLLAIYDDDYILNLFIERFTDLRKRSIDSEAHGIESDHFSDPGENLILKPNFDPEQIRVDPKNFSVLDVVRFIEKGRIDLSPDFQRYFVWKDTVKQSRLIESLLLRIPLPVFYLSEDNDGLYQVVDGLQRLTTIQLFYSNNLKLKGLEYLEDCKDLYFSDLKLKYKNRLEDTQLTFNIISSTTPVSVKFEIFKRINEGGKPLNRQEIRNSMAKSEVREFIKKLTLSEEFKLATDNSIKPIRMEDQELILRYVAFYISKFIDQSKIYKGDMESFLDDTLEYLNKNKNQELLNRLERGFYNAMNNAFLLFERLAFRKINQTNFNNNRRSLINKSLFTVWSVLLSQYNPSSINVSGNNERLLIAFIDRITNDPVYNDALTIGTNQSNKINLGFEVAQELILDNLNVL